MKAGSETETGNTEWGPVSLGSEGGWPQLSTCSEERFPTRTCKTSLSSLKLQSHQMIPCPAPTPSFSHTQPTSIWRDISPMLAPVTSTVVAQPMHERRIWFSKSELKRHKSSGIIWVVCRKPGKWPSCLRGLLGLPEIPQP